MLAPTRRARLGPVKTKPTKRDGLRGRWGLNGTNVETPKFTAPETYEELLTA